MYFHLVLMSKLSSPYSRLMSTNSLSSSLVRKTFTDYFVKDNSHTHVPSSRIQPLADQTVPFVNAGMNQFKTILQGKISPPWPRAANSQKCARVGGRHNDLDAVGKDGYHHTFFEMLGNWSFGDYFKEDACSMAWQLLTGPYRLDPQRLYVTYFGGDESLGLKPDLECLDIWRQIGVQANHILPFGVKENFWEMGSSGPCGPCTEIHVDHCPGRQFGYKLVNSDSPDVTELWNIVFVQYNRNMDGTLTTLPNSHVDTGMGLERLVAVLNGYSSNYDTDLFRDIIKAIHKITGVPAYSGSFENSKDVQNRDQAYRILSDHVRLLTVAIADGMKPNHEHKLRWVLRKALREASSINSDYKLLSELTNYVAESLGDTYPEIGRNLNQVQWIIQYEAETFESLLKANPRIWKKLVKTEPQLEELLCLGTHPETLSTAFKKVQEFKGQELPASVGYYLYDSHGCNKDVIEALARIVGTHFDADMFRKELENSKLKSKWKTAFRDTPHDLVEGLSKANIALTNDSFKYEYQRVQGKEYQFPILEAKILAVIADGGLTDSVENGTNCGIVMDRTNMYHTAGGQTSDKGLIVKETPVDHKGQFNVTSVENLGGYVIHYGKVNGRLKVGDEVSVKVDSSHRMSCMRNHTASHLVNGELSRILTVTSQEGCSVNDTHLKMSFSLYGEDLGVEGLKKMEESIKETIAAGLPVDRRTVTPWEMMNMREVTLIPNETYPEDSVHIIDIRKGDVIISREPCCGTHVQNTADLGTFCITQLMMDKNKKKVAIVALTGKNADDAIKFGENFVSEAQALHQDVISFDRTLSIHRDIKKLSKCFEEIFRLKKKIKESARSIPYQVFCNTTGFIEEALPLLDRKARMLSESEIKAAADGKYFIVHSLQSTKYLDSVLLHKVTRCVPHTPVMVFAPNMLEKKFKARCCVPMALATTDFNAKLWMMHVAEELGVHVGEKLQEGDPFLAFNLPAVKMDHNRDISMAVEVAIKFAKDNFDEQLYANYKLYADPDSNRDTS